MTEDSPAHIDKHSPTEMQPEKRSPSLPASSMADEVEHLENTRDGSANNIADDANAQERGGRKPLEAAQEAGGGSANTLPRNTGSSSPADSQFPSKTTLRPVSKDNKAHKALNIPNEIFFMILRLLSLRDVLDDFARFTAVAAYPHLVDGIKSIRFESGTIDIFHIVYELAAELSSTYNDMLSGPARYINSETRKRSAILEYARWDSAWRSSRQDYKDVAFLASVFQQLPKLTSIVIARKACSFKNSALVDAFAEGSLTSNFERANEEFVTVLAAIDESMEDRLKFLSHDELPVTFFTQYSSAMEVLTRPLQYLETLHLTFDATEPPLISFWKGFRTVLRSANHLVDLRFGFLPLARFAAIEGAWCFSDEPKKWYLPLWKLLGCYTLRKLRRLRLDGLLLCESGLVELLMRHKTTLQHLYLHQIGLWEGSFRNLLAFFRDELALKTFDISGRTKAFHAAGEHWRIKPARSSIPNPCPTGMHYYTLREYRVFTSDPPFSQLGTSEYLSQFILLHKDWMLEEADAVTDPLGDSHSPICEDCSIDRDEINKEWAASEHEDLDSWEESEYKHLVPGEDYQPDYDVCEAYDEDGYDDDGFNRWCFHESGLHYTDPLIHPDDGYIADGRLVVLKKELIKEIKRNIPRFNK